MIVATESNIFHPPNMAVFGEIYQYNLLSLTSFIWAKETRVFGFVASEQLNHFFDGLSR